MSIVKLSDLEKWANTHKNNFNFGDVVAVNGQMGFGKTTLIRHLIKSFGSNSDATSPTFGLMDIHQLKHQNCILHIDAYRIKNISEIFGLGIDHYQVNKTLIFIEWSQNIPEYILKPNKIIEINLCDISEARKINYFSV